jgi:hypothetical protein
VLAKLAITLKNFINIAKTVKDSLLNHV